ncbi:50S ribosomal protein L10 [Iamia sp. SCSIO 61187]|uniref:50S ribosomal protein L10 n=1 Tax=Iamia sp. SCSIO 61187 TaxID=2722752 RepID=UPI001C628CA3|nr:50S ribosomal protein L10 [Iamia sp. SCSIO 61187]QYG94781.1 50S ribosomal protein L10 [Iamia sp. SCSIO 61187]
MGEPRPEKAAVVTEVGERLDAAEAAVLTEYRGLDVPAMAELRDALRSSGGTYKIYKNTLVRIAARERGLDIDDLLTGPTAIAFVDGDAAGVAKALRDFARTNPALVVKGGLLGTSVLGADEVKALADLPSRDQLLAEIAGLFAAPMQQMASLLDAVPRSFSYALNALIEAGGAPGAPTDPAPAAEETPAEADAAATAEAATTESADADATESAPADDTTETPAESAATEES